MSRDFSICEKCIKCLKTMYAFRQSSIKNHCVLVEYIRRVRMNGNEQSDVKLEMKDITRSSDTCRVDDDDVTSVTFSETLNEAVPYETDAYINTLCEMTIQTDDLSLYGGIERIEVKNEPEDLGDDRGGLRDWSGWWNRICITEVPCSFGCSSDFILIEHLSGDCKFPLFLLHLIFLPAWRAPKILIKIRMGVSFLIFERHL